MASVTAKHYARYIYRVLAILHWIIFTVLAVSEWLAIHFDDEVNGYWIAGIPMGFFLLVVSFQDIVIIKTIIGHEKSDSEKRKFYSSFNCYTPFVYLAVISCIPGLLVPAIVGTGYASGNDDDKNSNMTSNDTSHDDEKYANIAENRLIATILTVVGGINLVVMVQTVCSFEEIRTYLEIPKDGIPQSPKPVPRPSLAPTSEFPSSSAGAINSNDEEVKVLKRQQEILKEQHRLQKEQLDNLHANNRRLQELAAEAPSCSNPTSYVPPPPSYGSLFTSDTYPGAVNPSLPHNTEEKY